MALVHISQVKNGPRRERQNKQMFILMVKDSVSCALHLDLYLFKQKI